MVSALPKGLEYKVEKLKCKKVGGHAPDDKNQILTSSRQINHHGSVHTQFYSRDWLTQSLFISEEWLGEGRGGA